MLPIASHHSYVPSLTASLSLKRSSCSLCLPAWQLSLFSRGLWYIDARNVTVKMTRETLTILAAFGLKKFSSANSKYCGPVRGQLLAATCSRVMNLDAYC